MHMNAPTYMSHVHARCMPMGCAILSHGGPWQHVSSDHFNDCTVTCMHTDSYMGVTIANSWPSGYYGNALTS